MAETSPSSQPVPQGPQGPQRNPSFEELIQQQWQLHDDAMTDADRAEAARREQETQWQAAEAATYRHEQAILDELADDVRTTSEYLTEENVEPPRWGTVYTGNRAMQGVPGLGKIPLLRRSQVPLRTQLGLFEVAKDTTKTVDNKWVVQDGLLRLEGMVDPKRKPSDPDANVVPDVAGGQIKKIMSESVFLAPHRTALVTEHFEPITRSRAATLRIPAAALAHREDANSQHLHIEEPRMLYEMSKVIGPPEQRIMRIRQGMARLVMNHELARSQRRTPPRA